MELSTLIDVPGERRPLVAEGEAHAVVRLLGLQADRDDEAGAVADELRGRLGLRLPAPLS
ncbi:hypothetical protein QCN29_36290 [Streptomyces sp. HNM0663]|uniref:Uncharacterized protein n=1 Tax=Streptomyces chengmaiensis TaxID=3040919 RepID=A0ABT6HZG3_9ACTN|nr:hypothetical protein [Streptomyces chengmaiensis]MDH2394101.1 hypothetical protein [Streptomyces chengmaiensis]